ncbi:MAG: type VI secretion system Vgr family protein, partial [Planctomycetaceae bacterium]
VLAQILNEHGVASAATPTTSDARLFRLQYCETDFDFVSRLLERLGIFYFFSHAAGGEQVSFANAAGSYVDLGLDAEFAGGHGGGVGRRVVRWQRRSETGPAKWKHDDYTWDLSDAATIAATTPALNAGDKSWQKFASQQAAYDFPGWHETSEEATAHTKARMLADEVGLDVAHGTGGYEEFRPGAVFTLKQSAAGVSPWITEEQAGKYVVTAIRHAAWDPTLRDAIAGFSDDIGSLREFAAGGDGAESVGYVNEFTAIPSTVAYAPPWRTPMPRIHGPQQAIVLDTHDPDQLARVKVSFMFTDKDAKPVESHWLRVPQLLAGKDYGGLFIPREDDEVIVGFLDGHPDRPVLLGG